MPSDHLISAININSGIVNDQKELSANTNLQGIQSQPVEEVQEESLPIQMGSGENAKEEEPFTLEEAKQVICTLGAAAGLTMERAMRDNPKIVAFIATKAPSTVKKEEVLAAKLLVNL